ncbi:MAG: hypothetical protein LBP58_01910, partial [Azoarcus sp.]|nr:hypothetical protein [Azoarcus sp.]
GAGWREAGEKSGEASVKREARQGLSKKCVCLMIHPPFYDDPPLIADECGELSGILRRDVWGV